MDSVSRDPETLLALADLNPEIALALQSRPMLPPALPDIHVLRAIYEKQNQHYLSTFGPDSAAGLIIENLTVTARDGYGIPIRTYRAEPSDAPGPLIIAIHGGAKVMGTITDEEGHLRLFAKRFNATCINIDYRLAPEHKSPIMIYDCWDVVQWSASHAVELQADPKKGFIIMGSSSGASVADVIAHIARDQQFSPPITGLLEICPSPCVYSATPPQYKDEFLSWDQDMTGNLPQSALLQFSEWAGTVSNPADPFNSSLLWPSGHKGMPPVFFQIHGRDYVRDGALIYERALREEAGVRTKLKVYGGATHGFNMSFPGTDIAKEHEKDTVVGIAWLLSLA